MKNLLQETVKKMQSNISKPLQNSTKPIVNIYFIILLQTENQASCKQQRPIHVRTAIPSSVSGIATYHIRVAIRRPTPTQSMNTTQSSSFIVSKKPMSSTNPNPTVDTEKRKRLLKSAVEKKARDLKPICFVEYTVTKSPVSLLFLSPRLSVQQLFFLPNIRYNAIYS